ncbi:hypothetical protein D9M68_830150 [compost metagenome]
MAAGSKVDVQSKVCILRPQVLHKNRVKIILFLSNSRSATKLDCVIPNIGPDLFYACEDLLECRFRKKLNEVILMSGLVA